MIYDLGRNSSFPPQSRDILFRTIGPDSLSLVRDCLCVLGVTEITDFLYNPILSNTKIDKWCRFNLKDKFC